MTDPLERRAAGLDVMFYIEFPISKVHRDEKSLSTLKLNDLRKNETNNIAVKILLNASVV